MRSSSPRLDAMTHRWRLRTLLSALLLMCAGLAVVVPATTSAAQPDSGTPRVEQLSLGHDHACALATNGHAWCWGKGDPADDSPAAEATFRQISASGNLHSCGVLTDGTVSCWGYDGDNQASPPGNHFTQVTTGGRHSCGVRDDGTLACWGGDDKGQATPPSGTFTSVSAGDSHTCAVAADRTIACWGANESGQVTAPAGTFLSVSAGYAHTCALQVDGSATCWGADDEGQTQAPADKLLQVSAGYSHTCGLSDAGRAVCWGNDAYGESTPPSDTFVEITAGYLTTCGLMTDGTLKCWGFDTFEDVISQATGPVGHWTIASGGRHSCATSSDSSVICWGADDVGQGDAPQGTWRSVSVGTDSSCALATAGTVSCWGPALPGTPPSLTLRQVAVSDSHACAIATDGTLACWGADDAGQSTPPAGAFSAVTVGTTHSCAIGADGSLACWGADDAGQATPPTGSFVALSAGAATTCAIAVDGSLACWGADDAGHVTPPQGRFVSIGVGDRFACAVASTGAPNCWGDTTAPGAIPTPKVVLSQIAVGGAHTCGIASNGILVCWGADDLGQSDPPVPGAPVLSVPIPDQGASEDAEFQFQVPVGTFTDTHELTWSVASGDGSDLPTWLRFEPATRTLSGTPTDADVGSLPITVTATDTTGLTGRATFTLTVGNVNDPPEAVTPIPDQDATEDGPWTAVLPEDAFTDADLDSGDVLTWSVASGDGADLPTWLRFEPATRTLSGTPTDADVGSLPITVTATDKKGASANTGFTISIARLNHPPTVGTAIPDQKAIQDQEVSFTFPGDTFAEQDADDLLAYDAVQKDGTPLPSWLGFAGSDRRFQGVPRDFDVGTLVISVTAMDKAGATASTDFALEIINVDDPPSLVSRIPDQTTDQDQPFTSTLSEDAFIDPDSDTGDTLRLRAVGPDGGDLPQWLTFDPDTRTFSGTPRDADAGNLVVTVVATDIAGIEASGSFTFTVNDVNDVPSVSQPTPDQLATVGQPFSLVLTGDLFTDPDTAHGDSLTYGSTLEDGSPLPTWLMFDPETLAFAGTPAVADTARLSVSVIATDSRDATGVDTFFLDVTPERDVPTAPVVVIRRVQVASIGSLATLVTWSAGKEATQGRAKYALQIRQQGSGKWGKYRSYATVSDRTGLNKNVKPGTYQLRLRATPAGGRAGSWIEGAPFTLRLTQESDPTIDYTGPWDKLSVTDATGGSVRRSLRPGSSFMVTAAGESIGLVMTSGKGQGIIEACLDAGAATPGGCRTIDLGPGKRSARKVVTIFRGLEAVDHTVTVTVRQGPVELDGVVFQSTQSPEGGP